jgi:UDPglucose 6-dehydrogenase
MKIVVVGLGYVGMSNAVLLAQHNEINGVDISQERVNARKSPIIDELSEYLAERELNLSASIDLNVLVNGLQEVAMLLHMVKTMHWRLSLN